MELRQLEYFEAVIRTHSFTRAADELHVTQPAVTTAIRNLETELRAVLVDRESCSITQAGEELLRHSEAILKSVRTIPEDIRSAVSGKSRLNVAVPPMSCAGMYPLILSEFSARHPEIEVNILDLCNADVIRRLSDGSADIGFLIDPGSLFPDLEYQPLDTGEIRVLLPAEDPLAAGPCVTFEDLTSRRVLMYEKGTSYTEVRILSEFGSRHLPLPEIHYFTYIFTIFDLVSQNYGVSFLPETDSGVLGNAPGVITRPFAEPVTYRIGIARDRSRHESDACRNFRTFVRECFTSRQ